MKTKKAMSVVLPFSGFYCSVWSDALDHELEAYVEYQYESPLNEGTEAAQPEQLRIDQATFGELLADCQNWRASCLAVSRAYVDQVALALPGAPALRFESLESPMFYNFETDRIFATIPFRDVVRLFRISKNDGHKSLAQTIRDNCTSRSGFHSYYPNDLASWLERPLRDWDHNHLGMLLQAVWAIENPGERIEDHVFGTWPDGLYPEFAEGIDWPRFKRTLAEKREELRAASATQLSA